MPSEFTPLGFNKQGPGENENAWGEILNDEVIDLVDAAIRGRTAFALSGTKTLTSTHGEPNEARAAILHITGGAGGDVIVPDISKSYLVINQATGTVNISAGGATNARALAGETVLVVADGQAAVRKAGSTDFGGQRGRFLANPLEPQDAATKAYVDAQAFESVDLPGQNPGTAGMFVKSNGANASWAALSTDDVTDYAADQAARQTAQEDFAVVMSLIF